ncbi:MAG: 2-phospho-L-lactate guanylyltransferase [Actinomycetota bacterium]|nr:2-phospho-L-lactate guanylyltransferase [Actinomycetota bacterium]
MRTIAVLPVKTFARAKRRLTGCLVAEQRAALAAAMVADVLAVLRDVAGLDELIVVSGEPAMSVKAAEVGARLLVDEPETSHSRAAARGIKAAMALDATRVLLVPGDCPALVAGQLDALLSIRSAGVVVVPDREGSGTNALLLQPPEVIAPSFGPGSCSRHVELARGAGVPVDVVPVDCLSLDIDTSADVEAVSALLNNDPARAPRTAAVLRTLADTMTA